MSGIDLIFSVLQRTIGLDPDSIGRRALESLIAERSREAGAADLDAYAARVLDDPRERRALIEKLVVPETWFFRDRAPFALLARQAAASWSKRDRPIRVLSIPCSTGEEPYSIAMTFLDLGLDPARFAIEAYDISEASLARACAGIYRPNAFRGKDLAYRQAHFNPLPDGRYEIEPRLRQCVEFRQGNILELTKFAQPASYDAIFSRNLLIYLDPPARESVAETFFRLLRPGGFLFVGHAETLPVFRKYFLPVKEPGAFAYRLPDASDALARRPLAPRSRAVPPASGKWIQRILPALPAQPKAPPAAAAAAPGHTSAPVGLDEAAILAQARQLADRGAYGEAASLCGGLLAEKKTCAAAHCLLGVIQEAAGQTAEAEQSYRRAIYLEPRHEEALSQLALLLDRRGNPREAENLRSRLRRLTAAASQP